MLMKNQWHLTHMPTLTYVAQFDFITDLTLEQCSQKLLDASREKPSRGKTHIYEVSQDRNAQINFAAKLALNRSAWYLAGHITPTASQKENRVSCYSGIPLVTFIIPFIFLIVVLIFVGITNHLSVVALLLLFIAILIIFGLVGMRYVKLFRQGLERDIRQLLNADEATSR